MIHVAIPSMQEASYLPGTLECLMKQRGTDFHLWVCVNQPDAWWDEDEKLHICDNNRQSLAFLYGLKMDNLHILDHSSKGMGWSSKSYGVGQARKVLMDAINRKAAGSDIIVSLDADTVFGPNYLRSILDIFSRFPHAVALSNPYFHKLGSDETLNRAMLRYEIYMRHYAINMWRIKSPYCFTALGSAIALPVWAYRKVGGITAKKSGEDFYFLQKLRKTGWICNYNTESVYPGTRYSDRVFFGTGPALIKGSDGNWDSYPVYDYRLFDQVSATYESFPALFYGERETPMSGFLNKQFRENDPFRALRNNANTPEQFVAACHQKIDGLRVLQFLKSETGKTKRSDEKSLVNFLERFHPDIFDTQKPGTNRFSAHEHDALKMLNFATSPISLLEKIRIILGDIEQGYQKNDLV